VLTFHHTFCWLFTTHFVDFSPHILLTFHHTFCWIFTTHFVDVSPHILLTFHHTFCWIFTTHFLTFHHTFCSWQVWKLESTLEQNMKPHRGWEVQLYSFFNFVARWGGWSTPRPGHFIHNKETRYPICRGWVGLRTRLDGCGKYVLDLPDLPSRRKSLYRLRYPDLQWHMYNTINRNENL